MQKMHIAYFDRLVVFYDLDVAILVGCRIKSSQGVLIRIEPPRVYRRVIYLSQAALSGSIRLS